MNTNNEPCYVISIAAIMLGIHAQTLRYYERVGLIAPSRSRSNIRLYSDEDIEKTRRIKDLIDNLGVNLAGVEVIMHMTERMVEMQRRIEEMETELKRLEGESAEMEG